MIRLITIVLSVLMLSSHAHACLSMPQDGRDLSQQWTRYIDDKGIVPGHWRMLTQIDGVQKIDTDSWWGETGDQFQVELTYTGRSYRNALGVFMDNEYREITETDNIIDVLSPEGFMWVYSAENCGRRVNIYSDPEYNYGQKDLFSAYSITNEQLLDYYHTLYGEDQSEPHDQLWLIAFHGWWRYRVKDIAALAVISSSSTSGEDPPVATPLPASVLLLAGGCFVLGVCRCSITKEPVQPWEDK